MPDTIKRKFSKFTNFDFINKYLTKQNKTPSNIVSQTLLIKKVKCIIWISERDLPHLKVCGLKQHKNPFTNLP